MSIDHSSHIVSVLKHSAMQPSKVAGNQVDPNAYERHVASMFLAPASHSTRMDQNGPKWSKNDPKSLLRTRVRPCSYLFSCSLRSPSGWSSHLASKYLKKSGVQSPDDACTKTRAHSGCSKSQIETWLQKSALLHTWSVPDDQFLILSTVYPTCASAHIVSTRKPKPTRSAW